MNFAIVSPNTKGQIVIPKAMRESLGITPESHLYLTVKNQVLYIQPFVSSVPVDPDKTALEILESTQGAWAGDNWPEEEKAYQKREQAAARAMKKAW